MDDNAQNEGQTNLWVVGVDLSLTSTAIAAMSTADGTLYVHRVRSSGKSDASLYEKLARAEKLADDIVAAVMACSPSLVSIEGAQFSTSKDSSAHRRAGLWWLVISKLRSNGVDVVEVPVSTVKKWATGKGNAGKDAMIAFAARRWEQVTQNDEADAAWLADISAYVKGASVVPRTKGRDAVLAKLDVRDIAGS